MSLVSSSLIGPAASAMRQDPADRVDELERPERLREVLRRAGREPDRAGAIALVRREQARGDVLGRFVGLALTAHVEAFWSGTQAYVPDGAARLRRPDVRHPTVP